MVASLAPLPDEDYVCADCGVAYASIGVPTALTRIRGLPSLVGTALSTIPDTMLRRRPDGTTWSALEYVCHLRDVYAVYTIRLYRVRVEDSPTLEPMLNDLRAARFRYNRRELAPVLAELADNVAGLTDEAARFSHHEWRRVATRLPGEERTALWMLRQAMHEGIHHVRDITTVTHRLQAATE